MFEECCPECGHLLPKNRKDCLFCRWDENLDQYSYSLKLENDLSYNDSVYSGPGEIRPDQLLGF